MDSELRAAVDADLPAIGNVLADSYEEFGRAIGSEWAACVRICCAYPHPYVQSAGWSRISAALRVAPLAAQMPSRWTD